MQHIHLSKLFISAALALLCTACSNKPAQTLSEYRIDFEGSINVTGDEGAGATTLYRPRLGSLNGQEGIAAQVVTTNAEQPIQLVTVGDTTEAKSTYATYGYTLFVRPEIQPRQFIWSEPEISTSIKLDHSVKLADGSASHKTPSTKVDLALGDEAKLNWSNGGKDYELNLRLVNVSPVGTEQVSKDNCETPATMIR
jgi:hypothetical protein